MISRKMENLVKNNSVIRAMFEEGKKLRKIYGEENVFDFSLGNPSVPAPKEINETIKKIVDSENSLELHGYMSNSGFENVRQKIAENLNKKYETNFNFSNFIMTVGAASGLNIVFKTILNPDDEVIVIAPYFSEYNHYIANYDGIVKIVKSKFPEFYPDMEELEKTINSKTKAILINTPNNPTGAVYPEKVIEQIANILYKKQNEYGNQIYLISDEPYRELVYEEKLPPFITKYYKNTIIVYSYSKSLSIPGERIGYVLIPEEVEESEKLIEATTIANRILGCVNAPSLMQKVVAECVECKTDVEAYKKNRDLLYSILKENNFECELPQGAFYMFVKTPMEDDRKFCDIAKKYNILVVPASSFAFPGYVRIAYCVSYEMIENSRKAFEKLAIELGIK